ncbi:unnamed protein product [Periconia digitata]|uniref:Uncharacterized protein n=1 Tax=Periconia digitata TaxID=1303443 RepID=A0A9W4XE26_9PLEO|nr:unnamed protein product [Periconia digitata]
MHIVRPDCSLNNIFNFAYPLHSLRNVSCEMHKTEGFDRVDSSWETAIQEKKLWLWLTAFTTTFPTQNTCIHVIAAFLPHGCSSDPHLTYRVSLHNDATIHLILPHATGHMRLINPQLLLRFCLLIVDHR